MFVATKKVGQQIFFHPFLFLFLDLGYEIRESEMDKNQNPG